MPDSITLHVHDATDAEIARGEAAARAVFEAADRTPYAAAIAFANAEQADDMGTLDDEDMTFDSVGVAAWLDALPAAVAACCAGWPTEPLYTNLIVRPEGEPRPPANQAITAEIDRLLALPDDELRALWAAFPDSSDELAALIYWAASERGLNSVSWGSREAVADAGASPPA